MITASTRVSDALAQRPDLINVLPAFHPAFAKLQHPVLGRIMPRLVTVADAAKIAGVRVDALLEVMNCGVVPSGSPLHASAKTAEPSPHPMSPPEPYTPGPGERLLDARPILDGGQDPLAAILGEIRALPPTERLTVIAPFEPVPLIGLLRRRGWEASVRERGGSYYVTFSQQASPTTTSEDTDIGRDDATEIAGGWSIDVRALPPPQPMQRILAAVDAGRLPLRVVHAREPALLWPHLEARGLAWAVEQAGEGVIVHVRRP